MCETSASRNARWRELYLKSNKRKKRSGSQAANSSVQYRAQGSCQHQGKKVMDERRGQTG